MENHYMDDLVKKALQNMDVPYDSSEWDQMAHRLEQEQVMRRQLMISKLIECSLLIFAIWTVHKILPTEYMPSANTQPAPQLYQDNKVPSESTPTFELDDQAFESAPRAALDQDPIIPNQSQPTQSLVLNHQVIPSPILIENQNNDYSETTTLEFSTSEYLQPETPTIAYVNRSPKAIPNKDFNSVSTDQNELARLQRSTIAQDPVPAKRKKPKTLGFAMSSDMNSISNNLDMGFSTGATIGFELQDRWTLETGLIFSNKSFDYLATNRSGIPINEKEIQKVNLRIFEIPLIAQFNFQKTTKWRSYAAFGIRAHIVGFSDFNASKLVLSHEIPEAGSRGAFQGGQLTSNFYASANVGFGFERRLTKSFSLFIQPSYQLSLNRMGPYEDKMNTLSLVMGARTTL